MISRLRRSKLFWLTCGLALSAPPTTHAHLINTGFGPFYDGLMHVFVSPEDLLPLMALAMFAGFRGPRFGRIVLFSLPVAWLIGAAVASAGILHFALPVTAMTLLTIVLGMLLAADTRLAPLWVGGLAILLGLLGGAVAGAELASTRSRQMVSAGAAIAIFVTVSLLAGQAASIRAVWGRLALRVLGSWIAAIGILMLGWSLRMMSPAVSFIPRL